MPSAKDDIEQIIREFSQRLLAASEAHAREVAIAAIQQALGGAAAAARAAGTAAPLRAPSPRRVLQGQYIGRLRRLKGDARARVQRVAREKGIEAAIRLADKLAK